MVEFLPSALNNVPTCLGWVDEGWLGGVILLNVVQDRVGGRVGRRSVGNGGLAGVACHGTPVRLLCNGHLLWSPTLVQMRVAPGVG